MADKKISQLPAATTPLAGTEVLPIVQSGTTVKVSVDNLTAGKPVSCSNLTVNAGNVVIGTSGKGIDFSATASGSGTMTSELLADYEEGTWTPTFVTTGTQFGSVTYGAVTGGKYTKVGNMVFVQCCIRTDAITVGSATGSVRIGGLPYTAGANGGSTANGNSAISVFLASSFAANVPSYGLVNQNDTTITLYTNIAGNPLAITDLGTGASANSFRFSATYIAA